MTPSKDLRAGNFLAFVVCPEYSLMNRITTTIFLGLVVLSVAGCTVHRKFAAQSVPSAAAVGTDKLPLTVAVIADPDLTFDYPRYWKAFVEVLNPGLGQTLQSAVLMRRQPSPDWLFMNASHASRWAWSELKSWSRPSSEDLRV